MKITQFIVIPAFALPDVRLSIDHILYYYNDDEDEGQARIVLVNGFIIRTPVSSEMIDKLIRERGSDKRTQG